MSGISDFGNFGPQSPNTANGPTPSSSNGGKSSPLSASSIQESELQALELLMIASLPILIAPQINGNSPVTANSSQVSGSINIDMEAKKNEIISKMWDSYIANIREIADRAKKEDIKKQTINAAQPGPKSSGEYLIYLMALSSTARADEIGANGLTVQFTQTYNQWLVNPVESGNHTAITGISNGYPSSSFLAGCVACNPDAIRNAIGASGVALGFQLSSSPVADALFAVGPTSGLPGDYQAAAALVAALLNGGAVYKASADTMAASGGAKPQYDLNFAVNYAKNVMAIVTKNIEGQESSNPERASQNTMIRLMLSAMALNMVYRSAYGGMQGKEFENLLAGNTADLPEEVKSLIEQLVSLVNAYLPQDPKSRANTIGRLMEYVDSKDSVDSMLETSRLFASFLDTNDLDATRLASGKS